MSVVAPAADRLLLPVILAGGRGTRLWPVSREARPKPFLKMAHGRSLLQDTLLRAAATGAGEIVIATHQDYYFQTDEDVDGISDMLAHVRIQYLLEPECRGTAPAIRMAARYARETYGGDALLLVLPSDHVIGNEAAFQQAVSQAALAAREDDVLVTLGIQPTAPETAFGYIQCDMTGAGAVGRAERFVEKPRREDAESFVASDRYAWNSGVFCFSVDSIERACARYMPSLEAGVEAVWASARKAEGLAGARRYGADAYAALPETSIDYAVMEKAGNVAVVRAGVEWQDIGSWEAMGRLVPSDNDGNKVLGQALLVNAHDNYVQADGRLVAAVGVNGLVIVDTPDALLVGAQGELQEIGCIADRLRHDGHEAGIVHRTVHRPWGTYTVLADGENHKVKRLCVKPGAALSLQLHHFRSEHWVVIAGIAQVTRGEEVFRLDVAGSTVIPPGTRHRIENPGEEDVVIIETQTGPYLGEDDIVRFDDDYGRAETRAH